MDPREGVGKDGGGGEGFPVVLSAGCAFVVLLFAYVARDGGKKKQTVKVFFFFFSFLFFSSKSLTLKPKQNKIKTKYFQSSPKEASW